MYRLFYFVLCLLFFGDLSAMRSITHVQNVAFTLDERVDQKNNKMLLDRVRKQSLAIGNAESLTDLLVAKAQTIIYSGDYYARMYYDTCLMNYLIDSRKNGSVTMNIDVSVDSSYQQCISCIKLTKEEKAVLLGH